MNQEILQRVLRSPRLPSLPSIALEVITLVQQRDVDLKQIARTIQHDPALAAKVLKTVNSSFYGQTHTISTISHALVVLGLNAVKTLALGFSLVGKLSRSVDGRFDHPLFWRRSVYAAVAARRLATQCGLVQQEEAFLAGLLQDLGMLAMNQTLGETYQQLLAAAGPDHAQLRAREQAVLGIDHAQVGGALAESWRLPPLLVEPIRHHEDPDAAPPELLTMVRCTALASRAADVFLGPQPGEALRVYHALSAQWLGLEPEASETLLKTIHLNTVEMQRLFDLDEEEGDADEILSRANEALLQISLQQAEQAEQYQQRQRQLQEERQDLERQKHTLMTQAATDALTGAANRRAFDTFLQQQFLEVQSGKTGPLSLLFLDVDHFKHFNDTYGHPTGDLVLAALARLLNEMVTDGGLVARYGGEEFALVLPRTSRAKAARQAEAVRQGIEAMTVVSDEGEALHITASIGAATYEGRHFAGPAQLIKAADQAVYAAKGAGRNCVRVFMPRWRGNHAGGGPRQDSAPARLP